MAHRKKRSTPVHERYDFERLRWAEGTLGVGEGVKGRGAGARRGPRWTLIDHNVQKADRKYRVTATEGN